MPPADVLIAFALATVVFAYMPGPAMLYAAAQTLARGTRGGLMAAFGIHLGCYVHVFAAAFGLSALFALVPVLFTVVKIAGAVYLIWLGIGILRGRRSHGEAIAPQRKSASRLFLESVLVEILNPKAALFFLAFLPQFVDPAAALPLWGQFLLLGTIVNLTFSSADLLVVLSASTLMKRLGRAGSGERILRVAGGSLLIGLGAKLALERH